MSIDALVERRSRLPPQAPPPPPPDAPAAAAPLGPVTLDVASSSWALARLRDEWTALADVAADGSVYLTHDFVTTWWEAFAPRQPSLELSVLVLRQGGQVIAIAPFARGRELWVGLPVDVVRMTGNAHSMRLGVLALPGREEAVAHLVVGWLRRSGADAASFEDLRADSPMTRALEQALTAGGFSVARRRAAEDSFVRCEGTFESYQQRLPRKARQSMERRARKAEREHEIEYQLETRPGDPGALFREIVGVARRTWSHREGTSIVSDTASALFYGRLFARAAAAGTLFAGILRVDGRPAAYAINVRHRGVVYGLKTGYDEAFGELGAGSLLRRFLLQQAFAAKADELDFGGHLVPYKTELCTGTRALCTLRAYRLGPAYLEHLVGDALLPRLRRTRAFDLARACRARLAGHERSMVCG